jgi:hypothetical protein
MGWSGFLPASGNESGTHTFVTAVALLVLAYFFAAVLVYDTSDNAYIGMIFIAAFLVVTAIPFGVASIWPKGRMRLMLIRGGLVLLLLSTALGTYMLIDGLTALDQYSEPQRGELRESHMLGLATLLPVSLLVLGSYVYSGTTAFSARLNR